MLAARFGVALVLAVACAGCRREEPVSETSTTSADPALEGALAIPPAARAPLLPTAADQGSAPEDLALLRAVRARLLADPSLSRRARSIVVVVQDGVVTLRGDVKDPVERELVVSKVLSVAGVTRAEDRLAPGATPPPNAAGKE